MYLQCALAAVLALTGLASPVIRSQDSPAQPDRVVGQDSASTAPGDIKVEEHAIIVPPVQVVGATAAPDVPPAAPAPAGSVVADHLVTPTRLESEVVAATGFQTLGVTWPKGTDVSDLGGQVRSRTDGSWSAWTDLSRTDEAPDPGSADAAHAKRGGTDSVSITSADAVQLSFAAPAVGGPEGLSLSLVGSPEKPTAGGAVGSFSTGTATIRNAAYSTDVVAASVAPRVISRAEWGAPGQICTPDVASGLVGAVLHHTAGSNSYSTIAGAEAQIRSDAAYHESLGWCDLGYNFVVDKWGNIYEGRAGSMTQAVIGVHAGGFNTGTVGVAMLGTYDAAPSQATQQAVAQIIGWRLGAYGIDPRGSMTYSTGVGENSRFINTTVVLPRVFGHRDVAYTACPGNGGEAALPAIRAMASDGGYADRFAAAQPVVKALYADLLGRAADPEGLQAWSAMLASGASQPALVAALTGSDEYIQLRVRQAYIDVLGREPEPGAVSPWITEIRAGRATVDDVKRRFCDSQEYYLRSGGTPGGYIALLYRTALQREAGPSEIAYWSARMAAIGRGAVVDGIWYSMEAAMYRTGLYYQVFLGRAPDPAGQQDWAEILLVGGEGAVRIGIAGSEEYRQRAALRFP